jgi:serine/threonine-protein kinase
MHPGVDVGTTLAGRFKLTGLLGGGGMAFVYRALDLKNDRPAAVKVLQTRQTRTEEFRKRFERESRLAEHSFHPNILPIWDAGEDGGVFYIATPLADYDLGALIAQHPQGIDPRRVMRIVNQVAHALDFAHSRNIVHRDVKPENILILEHQAAGDHAFLADFGIAKDVGSDERLTGTRFTPMSPTTAAPEQISGDRELDGRTDQYALTCTLYEALCGQPVYQAQSAHEMLRAHLYGEPQPITLVNRSLPVALNNVLAQGMAREPQDRYASCQELVAEARDALGVPAEAEIAGPDLRDTEAEDELDEGKTVLDPGRFVTPATAALTELEGSAPAEPGPRPVTRDEAPPPADRDGDRPPTPWYKRVPVLAGALVLVAAIGVGVALAAGGGGDKKSATTPASASAQTTQRPATTATTPTDTTPTDTTPTDTTPTDTTPTQTTGDAGAGAPQSARYRQSDMRQLFSYIPYRASCAAIRWSGHADRIEIGKEPPGAAAAIKCNVNAGRDMKAYYVMFTTDARMNSAFRDYIHNAALGFTYDAKEASCGGRAPGPIRWTNHGRDAGRLDCVTVPYSDSTREYGVVWTANGVHVLTVLQDTSSMHDVYVQWPDSGPNF